MIVIVLCAIVAIVVVYIILRKDKKTSIDKKSDYHEIHIDLDEPTSSVIHFSDDFKSGEPITRTEENHIITTILMSKEDALVWVCPTCETENPLSKKKCCVCHSIR